MKHCFECGKPADHEHHVVPKALGGTKTIPLCESCHGLIHDRQYLNHRELTKAGLRKARAQGVKLGRPKTAPGKVAYRIAQMRGGGMTLRAIADALNAEGVKTGQGGKCWYASTVKCVLTNA